MNLLKLIVLSAALMVSVTIMAQDQNSKKQNKVKQLTEELDLTNQQQEEVALIYKEIKKEKESIRTNESLDKTEKRKALKELNEKADAKLKAALTEKQYMKYTEMKVEKKDSRKGVRSEKKNEMYESLGLSSDQVIQVESLNEKIRVKKNEIRNNTSISDEEKKTALKELKNTRNEGMKAILTAEQYKQIEAMKKEKKGARGKQRMQDSPEK